MGNFYHNGILSGGRTSMGGGKSHVTPDSPYSGNMMCPQQKHQFHTIIINHLSLEICLHVSFVTSQLAHNQRLQVSG